MAVITSPRPPDPYRILAAARLLIQERAPYFQAGVLQLIFRESPGLGGFAATRGWLLLWDPAAAIEFGIEGTAACIVHELWHLLRGHGERLSMPLMDPDLANIAACLSVAEGLNQMGFKMPDGYAIHPKMLTFLYDLTAEEYYVKLTEMARHGDIIYSYYDGTQGGTGGTTKITVHGCGSAAGRRLPGEPIDDPDARSEAESQRTRITIAKAMRETGRGRFPSDFERWVDDALRPPRIRWEDKLRRACRAAVAYRSGGDQAGYTRPSRRQGGIGYGPGCPILPSFRATRPLVTFLVDTSGSMSAEQLRVCMEEAKGVFSVCGAHLDFVVCDAAVHAVRSVQSIQEACLLLKGGGGSDFRPAFDQIEAMRPRPHIVVAATDGDIAVPECEPSGIKVIWLLVGSTRRPCEWGVAVEVGV